MPRDRRPGMELREVPGVSEQIPDFALHKCARDGNEKEMEDLLQQLKSQIEDGISESQTRTLIPGSQISKWIIEPQNTKGIAESQIRERFTESQITKGIAESQIRKRFTETEIRGMIINSKMKERINQYDKDKVTPLHYAVRFNSLAVIKLLVEEGADVNKTGGDGLAPLHYAARYRRNLQNNIHIEAATASTPTGNRRNVSQDQESVVKYFVSSKGAQVNAPDRTYNQTPLHYTAVHGNVEVCWDLLQDSEINIEAKDKRGTTPLHIAAIHNQVQIARMLIEKGANPRSTDHKKSTPLHHACTEGNADFVRAFFAACVESAEMVEDKDCEENTCLHLAVENGHYEVARLCIAKGAKVNITRKHSVYPLHLAAMLDKESTVENMACLLVEKGAKINARNDEDATALHKAASLGNVAIVRYLVNWRAHIDCRDINRSTPLLLAATHGCSETVDVLLQMKADHSAVDRYNRTAIYCAAEKRQKRVLEVLLSHPKAELLVNMQDQFDNSPLHVASKKGYLDIVDVLLSNGALLDAKNEDEQTPLHLAARHGHTEIVVEIIKRSNFAMYDKDKSTNTPLHLAAQYEHKKVVDTLLEHGADISARNHQQQTPLDVAAQEGSVKICRKLLDRGAPIDPTDKNLPIPLLVAAQSGHPHVVELLLERGADVTQVDSKGLNCLDLAIDNNHADVALKIISSDHWEAALRHSTKDDDKGHIDTPMRKLIRKMPDVAEKVFDRCMTVKEENNGEQKTYELIVNYEFLDDTYASWIPRENSAVSKCCCSRNSSDDDKRTSSTKLCSNQPKILKQNHPLCIMVRLKRGVLLDHPLVDSLLKHKWNTFGFFFYHLSFIVYCVFVVFLSGYVMTAEFPATNLTLPHQQAIADNNCTAAAGNLQKHKSFLALSTYVIIAFAAVNLLKELMQIRQDFLGYLNWTNLIEWTTYVTAVLFVFNFNECQRYTGLRYHWQWQLGAVSIFLAWFTLVLLMRTFPRMGIYVVMFTSILKTFSKFFVVFFLFVIAFALSFHAVLQNQVPFRGVRPSLLKTSVMLLGELEFDSTFNGDDELYYPVVSYILFVFFMIFMSIILMNLLIGLAVDDIKAVQEMAALECTTMQIKLAMDVEQAIPDSIWKLFLSIWKLIKPSTTPSSQLSKSQKGLTSKALQDYQKTEQETLAKLSDDIRKLKHTVKKTSKCIEYLLYTLLLQHDDSLDERNSDDEDEVEYMNVLASH